MTKRSVATIASLSLGLALATGTTVAAPCNEADTAGSGTLGTTPGWPTPGLGFDVGGGQCNGSFTLTTDAAFPSADGDGIELGIRIEQRRVGQVTNNDGDYTVQVGPDTTQANRSWWNFQHSIAYDGNINELDALTFHIRVDAGTSVSATPADLLAFRAVIDDRHPTVDRGDPFKNPTATYSDLYQTSQNPVFGWFAAYDMNEEGAWKLILTAEKDGETSTVSVCVHTPNAICVGDLAIDVRPKNTTNQINTNARQQVPIAILGSDSFDACLDVDFSSIFAHGAQPSVTKTDCDDVNGDLILDRVLYFRARNFTKPTAEECADPNAMLELTGTTLTGDPLAGSDRVTWQGPDCL